MITKQRSFRLHGYTFVSQDPTVISSHDRAVLEQEHLPAFVRIWRAIEKATGFRWKCTSLIRPSPNHRSGHAFDLAPDIHPDAEHLYAVHSLSDPVLYKREPLIRALQTLRDTTFIRAPKQMAIFLEPDHLHIQVVSDADHPTSIIKWKVPKPVYPDTYERMTLPMIR
jgi:hypothetical protein